MPPPLHGVAALIIKPSVLGGYERAAAWARLARREGLEAVVSAAFPSAVGLALDAAFAAAIAPGGVHGLGTADALAEDLGARAHHHSRTARSTPPHCPSGRRTSHWSGRVSSAERIAGAPVPAGGPGGAHAGRAGAASGPRRLASGARGGLPALSSISFAELERLTRRGAHGLLARGLPPGERVALLLPPGPAYPVALLPCCAPAASRSR